MDGHALQLSRLVGSYRARRGLRGVTRTVNVDAQPVSGPDRWRRGGLGGMEVQLMRDFWVKARVCRNGGLCPYRLPIGQGGFVRQPVSAAVGGEVACENARPKRLRPVVCWRCHLCVPTT
jgi:hypothetical protein